MEDVPRQSARNTAGWDVDSARTKTEIRWATRAALIHATHRLAALAAQTVLFTVVTDEEKIWLRWHGRGLLAVDTKLDRKVALKF